MIRRRLGRSEPEPPPSLARADEVIDEARAVNERARRWIASTDARRADRYIRR